MAEAITAYPKFHNNAGVPEIKIGAREFECVGATPPHDHPHVYLDMGHDETITCPYCSTVFRYDASLKLTETEPADQLFAGGKVTER